MYDVRVLVALRYVRYVEMLHLGIVDSGIVTHYIYLAYPLRAELQHGRYGDLHFKIVELASAPKHIHQIVLLRLLQIVLENLGYA